MHNSEGKLPGEHHVSWIGPLQLAIHVVQNRHAGEQKTHWGKQTKGIYTFKINGNFLCLSCPSTTFALKCFGLVPREWLDAKGLLGNIVLIYRQSLKTYITKMWTVIKGNFYSNVKTRWHNSLNSHSILLQKRNQAKFFL